MGRDMANSRVTIMARRPPPGQRALFTGAKRRAGRPARAGRALGIAGPGATIRISNPDTL